MSRSSFTFFILIVSFGILFAGCGIQEPDNSFEEFTFTEDELAALYEEAEEDTPVLSATADGDALSPDALTESDLPVVDENTRSRYEALRTAVGDQESGIYRVNNEFLNVRADTVVTSALIDTLTEGELVRVVDMPNAEWAKVQLEDGAEGYVAFRYLARMTSEEKLADERKAFEGKYFVDFAFVNMRREPSTQSEKLTEVPGKTILTPSSIGNGWARVHYDGNDGYVSTQYLTELAPAFLVRQESYTLPILQYRADDTTNLSLLNEHVSALRGAGKKVTTLKSLYDLVLAQESRDVRVSPGTVVLVITGVNADNINQVTNALEDANVNATLFVQTKDLGLTGITERMVLTILANGHEIQSGGHTGDDLRTMTDAQVRLELGQSKKLIEEMTKREVYAVQYPSGGVNDRVLAETANRAYLFGISQSPDTRFTRAQFLRLPTLLVASGMTGEDVVKLTE